MSIWESIFSSREWGKYPPEELVRIASKFKKQNNSDNLKCLELGPGPGANSLLLMDLFDQYCAIDVSSSAIMKLKKRIISNFSNPSVDLRVGCFSSLPWGNNTFDFVCDNFSTYANKVSLIKKTFGEVARVLSEKSNFYSRVWGLDCYGLETGTEIETNTYQDLKESPCAGFGISHFYSLDEIHDLYSQFFDIVSIKKIETFEYYIDEKLKNKNDLIQEYIIISKKKKS